MCGSPSQGEGGRSPGAGVSVCSPCFGSCLQGLPPDRGVVRPGSLDAEIDSLTSMLADLDGGRSHAPRRADRQVCVLCPVSASPSPASSLLRLLSLKPPSPPTLFATEDRRLPACQALPGGNVSKPLLAKVPRGMHGPYSLSASLVSPGF